MAPLCYSNIPVQENIEILKMAEHGFDGIQAEKHRTVDCKMWKHSVRKGAVSGKRVEASQGEQVTCCKLGQHCILMTLCWPQPVHVHTRPPSHPHPLTHAHSMWLLWTIRSKNWRSIRGLSETHAGFHKTRQTINLSAATPSETCHLNCHYHLPSNDTSTFNSCSIVDFPSISTVC